MVVIIIYLIYFILVKPTPVKYPMMEFLLHRPIAHRGLHNIQQGVPENSLEAFRRAIQEDYPIELDIHLSKDGEVVVFHDDDLTRMTGASGKIEEKSFAELAALTLQNTQEYIPALKEVLQLVKGRVPLLIEFKNYTNGELEQRAWEILKGYGGNFAVQSFDFRSVRWFRKKAPHVLRGQLALNSMKDKKLPFLFRLAGTQMLTNIVSRPHFASYQYTHVKCNAFQSVRKMKGKGLVWTLRSQEDYDKLKALTDNIIFEGFIPKP